MRTSRIHVLWKVSLIFFLFSGITLYAQSGNGEIKILASDGDIYDSFGYSVDIANQIAIIGAEGDDDNGILSGSAYIFSFAEGHGAEIIKLLPGDGAETAFFGNSVAISDEYVVVAAVGDDEAAEEHGAVYVFERIGNTWREQAKLIPSNPIPAAFFGISVDVFKDRIAVGALNANGNAIGSGAVYIFKKFENEWIQEAKLFATDGEWNDWFGWSVAINNSFVAVGSMEDDTVNPASGSVYIYQQNSTGWIEYQIIPKDSERGDRFGSSVSLFENHLLVGAVGVDDKAASGGGAYIFHNSNNEWRQEAKLLADDGQWNDNLGWSAALSGNFAVLGSAGNDANGDDAGAAYVFHKQDGDWVQKTKLLASNGVADDRFGRAVAILHDEVIVGAYRNDNKNGINAGAAYYYDLSKALAINTETVIRNSNYNLYQNYPNPFNGSTTIQYELPEAAHVNLTIYDLIGKRVVTLVNERQGPGANSITWSGENASGNSVRSGIYIYQLQADNYSQSRKMLLIQ